MPQPPSKKRKILVQSKLFNFATRTPPRPKAAAVTAVDAQLPLPPRNNSNRKQGDEQTATPATPLPEDAQQLPPPLNERNDDLKKLKQQGDETTMSKSTPAVPLPVDAQQLPLPPPLLERNDQGDGIVEPGSSTSSPFPDLWSDKMWKERKRNYPWLDFKDGKLGCKVCSSITDFSVFGLSIEWTKYEITHNGTSRSAMLMSIRKKVCKHNNSDAHNKAEHIVNEAKKLRIEK